MKHSESRQQLIDFAIALNKTGLSPGKSGNISQRCEHGMLITPSGLDYATLQVGDIVHCDLDGQPCDNDKLAPSSEWHFHAGIYRQQPHTQAVVHAHPRHCTALACSARDIPAFHYMVAIAGGDDIPLAPYALFGSEELSNNACLALTQRRACLLESHGMIATGDNLDAAFKLAQEVEELAAQYCTALSFGEPSLLSEQQMTEVLEKFEGYGQRL